MLKNLYIHIGNHKKQLLFFLIAMSLSILVAGSTQRYGFLGPLAVLALATSSNRLVNMVNSSL